MKKPFVAFGGKMDNIIGKEVCHKTYGAGIIAEKEKGIIYVQFGGEVKRFSYPDAFENYLTTQDIEFQLQIQCDLEEKQKQAKRQKAVAKELSPVKPKHKFKKVERSNIAFKCNFCDGGAARKNVGFNGVCSDEVIRYNIEQAKHVWCSDEDCPCKQYLDGEISRKELTANMQDGGYVCYESAMLRDWRADAGVIQTGENKGKPKRLLKVQHNSLAILTTREPDDKEDRRYIFAVFLVDESFEGDAKEEGYVTTKSEWKIKLTPHEAHKMLFWKYYVNGKPETIDRKSVV